MCNRSLIVTHHIQSFFYIHFTLFGGWYILSYLHFGISLPCVHAYNVFFPIRLTAIYQKAVNFAQFFVLFQQNICKRKYNESHTIFVFISQHLNRLLIKKQLIQSKVAHFCSMHLFFVSFHSNIKYISMFFFISFWKFCGFFF